MDSLYMQQRRLNKEMIRLVWFVRKTLRRALKKIYKASQAEKAEGGV